jgi:hypothetical protein
MNRFLGNEPVLLSVWNRSQSVNTPDAFLGALQLESSDIKQLLETRQSLSKRLCKRSKKSHISGDISISCFEINQSYFTQTDWKLSCIPSTPLESFHKLYKICVTYDIKTGSKFSDESRMLLRHIARIWAIREPYGSFW